MVRSCGLRDSCLRGCRRSPPRTAVPSSASALPAVPVPITCAASSSSGSRSALSRTVGWSLACRFPTTPSTPARQAALAHGRAGARPSRKGGLRIGFVDADSDAFARLAARELLKRDFASYAFVSAYQNRHWSQRRQKAFREAIGLSGGTLMEFDGAGLATGLAANVRRLGKWLKELPKPCGLLAANDRTAALVLTAAARHGVTVPDMVSVVGIDDDEISEAAIWPDSLFLILHPSSPRAKRICHTVRRGLCSGFRHVGSTRKHLPSRRRWKRFGAAWPRAFRRPTSCRFSVARAARRKSGSARRQARASSKRFSMSAFRSSCRSWSKATSLSPPSPA